MKLVLWVGMLALLAVGNACVNSESINARFAASSASWYRFTDKGIEKVSSPRQAWTGKWKPYAQADRATDVLNAYSDVWAAVNGLGLVELSDAEGDPKVATVNSPVRLAGTSTGLVFPFDDKIFLTLYHEPSDQIPPEPPLSLAWYQPGGASLVFYPVPSQVQNPRRQGVFAHWNPEVSSVDFVWKFWGGRGWTWENSRFALSDGTETELGNGWKEPQNLAQLPNVWKPLWYRLAERTNGGLSTVATIRIPGEGQTRYQWPATSEARSATVDVNGAVLGDGQGRVAVSDNGFLVYQKSPGADVRLFRLFDLGVAGRYTAVVAARHGLVLAWETFWRSYCGSAGLVYIPDSRLSD